MYVLEVALQMARGINILLPARPAADCGARKVLALFSTAGLPSAAVCLRFVDLLRPWMDFDFCFFVFLPL